MPILGPMMLLMLKHTVLKLQTFKINVPRWFLKTDEHEFKFSNKIAINNKAYFGWDI